MENIYYVPTTRASNVDKESFWKSTRPVLNSAAMQPSDHLYCVCVCVCVCLCVCTACIQTHTHTHTQIHTLTCQFAGRRGGQEWLREHDRTYVYISNILTLNICISSICLRISNICILNVHIKCTYIKYMHIKCVYVYIIYIICRRIYVQEWNICICPSITSKTR